MNAMTICRHTNWFRIWKNREGTGIEVTDKPRRLIEEMKDPDGQLPAFLVILGNDRKRFALTKLQFGNEHSRSNQSHGDIHLLASSSKKLKHMAVIIADGDLPNHGRLPTTCRHPQCHEVAHVKFSQDQRMTSPVELADSAIHRAVLPFADLVCLFVEDIGGVSRAISHIASWAGKGISSTHVRPQLMLLVDASNETYSRMKVGEFLSKQSSLIHESFKSLSISVIPDLRSRKARCRANAPIQWRKLRDQIISSLENSRQQRRVSHNLFSARHLCQYLRCGTDSITNYDWKPFNPIVEARKHNKIATNLTTHLASFLKLFDSVETVKDVAIPLIASSFVLDHYPPGMYYFDPRTVFETIYGPYCSALWNCRNDIFFEKFLPPNYMTLIEEEMMRQYKRFQTLKSSKAAHMKQIFLLRPGLQALSSEETCLLCLRRKPQMGLQCIHSMCNVCIRTFGIFHKTEKIYSIEECLLCGVKQNKLNVRRPPETSAIRILSFEGGGARGIGSIESLIELQKRVGLPYPVIRLFDLCYATSCGSGIMLKLCDGRPIESCREYFANSARLAFQARWFLKQVKGVPLLEQMVLALTVLLTDSKYPSSNLDAMLQQEYGHTRTIISHSNANEMGILYGITLTTVGSSKTVIVSNYNGVGEMRKSLDYDIIQSTRGMRSIPLWEWIRCAVAAPFYFTPHKINGVGYFQDGGLHANNPVGIAIEEAAALYPEKVDPSTIVSVATGSSISSGGSSFLGRLRQAFERATSSDSAWDRLPSHRQANKISEHFRLDFTFKGNAPPLDEVDKMGEVSLVAREAIKHASVVDRLASHLRAQLFYFELDTNLTPQFVKGVFVCQGFIRCRLEPAIEALAAFEQQLRDSSATFHVAGQTIPIINEQSVSIQSLEYRRSITLRLNSRLENFEIFMEEEQGQPLRINGSPFTLDRLIQQQKLEAVFGTEDHRERLSVVRLDSRPCKRRRLR